MHRLAGGIAAAILVVGSGSADFAFGAEPSATQLSLVSSAAQAGMLEVEAARIALAASKNTAVKEYAYRILYDHEKINADLAEVARKRGIELPSAPDAQHAAILQSLRDAPAQQFDTIYLEQVIIDRAKTAEQLQSNLQDSDAEVAVFSSYNLPKVRGQARLAEELKAQLTR